MRGDTNIKDSDSSDPSIYFLFCDSGSTFSRMYFFNQTTELTIAKKMAAYRFYRDPLRA